MTEGTDREFSGRSFAVLGAGGGIGEAVALELSQCGASLALLDRDPDRAEQVLAKLHGSGHIVIAVDVSDPHAADAWAVAASRRLGRLDGFINLAAVDKPGPLMRATLSDWASVMDVNVRGAFLSGRAAARQMRSEDHGGSIVMFTSLAAGYGTPDHGIYAASKAALNSLVRTMSVEWLPFGIRVNGIAPVATETPLLAALLETDPTARDRMTSRIPARRLGRPSDYSGAVRFLLSPSSDLVVGQVIGVDGGSSVLHPFYDPQATATPGESNEI